MLLNGLPAISWLTGELMQPAGTPPVTMLPAPLAPLVVVVGSSPKIERAGFGGG